MRFRVLRSSPSPGARPGPSASWASTAAALGLGVLCAAPAAAPASAAERCSGPGPHVTTIVEGLRSTKGDVVVEIYPDDPQKFLARKQQVASVHQKLDAASATVCLSLPAPGWYALAVFHDENSDYKINRNFLGIPTEGVDLSNNPPIHLGIPPFSQIRFQVDGDTTLHVKLKYWLG